MTRASGKNAELLSGHRCKVCSGAYALLGGLVTLAGWFAHLPRLTDWISSGIAMFPNTAAAAVLAGAALLLPAHSSGWLKKVRALMGLLVAFLGGATLFEHVSGINLGIDSLLFSSPWGSKAASSPGRMGPPASTSFALVGMALILAACGQRWARRAVPPFGIATAAISLLSVTGYLFGADPLFSVARFTGIAMQTATIILALALGIIASVPEHEPMRTLTENSAAGILTRLSLPFIVVSPIALGWLRVSGQNAQWVDTGMGTALLVLSLITIFSGLLCWWVRAIRKHEVALHQSEARLRTAHEQLSCRAADLDQLVQQRTARLQETVAELEAFSYSMAHDMRAPLRAMQGFANLLLTEHLAQLDPLAQDYLQRIGKAANRLDGLIVDILNYSKLVRSTLQLRPVPLDKLVRDVLESYPAMHKDKADVIVDSPLPHVLAHEAALTQIVSNLLDNAVKFVAPGVRPRVRVWAASVDGMVRLCVADNGVGIPKDFQPRLFKIFTRFHPPESYEGRGIGLAVVRKAVERMGGTVGVESDAGRGSQFWVCLQAVKDGQLLGPEASATPGITTSPTRPPVGC